MSIPNLRTIERIAKTRKTPFLTLDREIISQRLAELRAVIANARIFYALKTNSHRDVIDLLLELGSGFEISSERELILLLKRGVSPENIIVSNPVKTIATIKASHKAGVNHFAFDSYTEIEKLARLAPYSNVYIRIVVSNTGSQWPLTRKFGVAADTAVELLQEAQRQGLRPEGITFHVGSQCMDPKTWALAIEESHRVWQLAEERGIQLQMLNIGGGFPIKYLESPQTIDVSANYVNDTIGRLFPPNISIFIEPGRVLMGEAGVIASTVIGKAIRSGEKWLYLDVGVFNGLMETIGDIKYPMISTKEGKLHKWVVAGPSCDSVDIIQSDVMLPELDVGDRVYILSAGAYTTAYASRFDGTAIPNTYVI